MLEMSNVDSEEMNTWDFLHFCTLPLYNYNIYLPHHIIMIKYSECFIYFVNCFNIPNVFKMFTGNNNITGCIRIACRQININRKVGILHATSYRILLLCPNSVNFTQFNFLFFKKQKINQLKLNLKLNSSDVFLLTYDLCRLRIVSSNLIVLLMWYGIPWLYYYSLIVNKWSFQYGNPQNTKHTNNFQNISIWSNLFNYYCNIPFFS